MTVRLAADVPDDHAHALAASAAAGDRTLAAELRRAIRMYVAMLEQRRTTGQEPASSSSDGAPAAIGGT